MRTLWETVWGWFFKKKDAPVQKKQTYNPLNARLENKSSLTVDIMDLRKYTFVVDKIVEFKLSYKDQSFVFTDYYCRSVLNEGEPVNIKLRVYPHDDPGRELQVLVLKQWDELDYDEDFKTLLDDDQFNTAVDDELEAEFWRINGVKTPYQATVHELSTKSKKDREVEERSGEVWYWDYWRETKDEGGTEYKEFLFVEFDKGDTGRFTIWRGEEVSQSRIFA